MEIILWVDKFYSWPRNCVHSRAIITFGRLAVVHTAHLIKQSARGRFIINYYRFT